MPPRTRSRSAADGAGRTVTGAEMRRKMGEQEHEEVTIRLAHYLPEGNPFDGDEHQAGDEITVKRHEARHLIGAGYAAVDAEDPVAVNEALQLAAGEPGSAAEPPPE